MRLQITTTWLPPASSSPVRQLQLWVNLSATCPHPEEHWGSHVTNDYVIAPSSVCFVRLMTAAAVHVGSCKEFPLFNRKNFDLWSWAHWKFSSWSMMRGWLPATRNWPDILIVVFIAFLLLGLFLSAFNYLIFPICLTKEWAEVLVLFTF